MPWFMSYKDGSSYGVENGAGVGGQVHSGC